MVYSVSVIVYIVIVVKADLLWFIVLVGLFALRSSVYTMLDNIKFRPLELSIVLYEHDYCHHYVCHVL